MDSAPSSNNQGDEHQTLDEKVGQLNLDGQAELNEPDDKKGNVKKPLKPTDQVEDRSKDAELDNKAGNESANEEDSDKCQQNSQPDQHSDDEPPRNDDDNLELFDVDNHDSGDDYGNGPNYDSGDDHGYGANCGYRQSYGDEYCTTDDEDDYYGDDGSPRRRRRSMLTCWPFDVYRFDFDGYL